MLTSKERISRILGLKPVDHIGFHDFFWGETREKWRSENHIDKNVSVNDYFKDDIVDINIFNMVADLDFAEQIVEETEETKLVRNGNGSLLRWYKKGSSTPEHVDYLVKDMASWEDRVRAHLIKTDNLKKRIDFQKYRETKTECEKRNLFFALGTANVFESMMAVCGHENMLLGMALEPDWVKDMCSVYSDLIINLIETVIAEEGKPDAVWYFEDMGYKFKPFMSPAMYKEIIWPAHKRTFDYAHSLGLPVIVHSCGFVEPLVPGLIEAGMNCLHPLEIKAGMDLLKMKKMYGARISFMGGIDTRNLVSNDKNIIKAELEEKIPAVMKGSGYILHSDHSVPSEVNFETYKYFLETALKLGTYKL